MVDWQRHRWVIWKHKTSKTARELKPRIIGMSDEVEAVLREREVKYGQEGHVFLNEDGEPWTRNALGLRVRRLRKRAGVRPDENGEEFSSTRRGTRTCPMPRWTRRFPSPSWPTSAVTRTSARRGATSTSRTRRPSMPGGGWLRG